MKNDTFQQFVSDSSEVGNGKKESKKKRFKKYARFGVRTVVCLMALLGVSIASLFGIGLIKKESECFEDKSFIYTAYINSFINEQQSKLAANSLLVLSALLLDIQLVTTCLIWLKHGKNWKPFISLTGIFILKWTVDLMYNVRYPQGMVYHYPGFPSLSVSYNKTSTFFFSGNISVSFLSCLIANKNNYKIISYLGVIPLFMYSLTSLLLRFHYVIDLLCGIVIAHYFYYLSKFPSKILEKFLPIRELELNFCELANKNHSINDDSK